MHNIIIKTYELIDALEQSDIIKELIYNKNILLKDKKVLSLINKYNKDNIEIEEKIKIKKELYNNIYYKNYIDNYNKLNYIILVINNKIKQITNTANCHKE